MEDGKGERKKGRERNVFHPLVHFELFTLKCFKVSRQDQAKVRIPELFQVFQVGVGLKHLGYNLLFSQEH